MRRRRRRGRRLPRQRKRLTFLSIHTCMHASIHTHMCVHKHTHTHSLSHTHIYVHAYMMYACTYIHYAYIMYACICTHRRTGSGLEHADIQQTHMMQVYIYTRKHTRSLYIMYACIHKHRLALQRPGASSARRKRPSRRPSSRRQKF